MLVTEILIGIFILVILFYFLYLCSNDILSDDECMYSYIGLSFISFIYIYYIIKSIKKNKKNEGFKAKLDYLMGRYSGLDLKENPNLPYENLTPQELVSKTKNIYHSPVGTSHSLTPDKAVNCNHPSVDGSLSSPKSMFMFAYNRSSPECCPNAYSNSRGCVCVTDKQKKYLRRGGSVLNSNNDIISGLISNN